METHHLYPSLPKKWLIQRNGESTGTQSKLAEIPISAAMACDFATPIHSFQVSISLFLFGVSGFFDA